MRDRPQGVVVAAARQPVLAQHRREHARHGDGDRGDGAHDRALAAGVAGNQAGAEVGGRAVPRQ